MPLFDAVEKPGMIVGIGSALVDLLLAEDEPFLKATGAAKGGMSLVDADRITGIMGLSKKDAAIVPGGSACNTIIGVGKLGGRARFIGKRGDDELGVRFESALRNSNVDPVLAVSSSPTGRVLSVITPDAQRTMFTCLGAAAEALPEELTMSLLQGAALVHIEGYLLFNPELIRTALLLAKSAGAKVSLDLASFTVVEAARPLLDELVDDFVDILIANEDEARAFTQIDDEDAALAAMAQRSPVAVLKVGCRGSLVQTGSDIYRIGIEGDGAACDTTGAGDLWASGFLHGLVNGMSVEQAAKLGALCGYEVCQVVGAHIATDGWDRILTRMPML